MMFLLGRQVIFVAVVSENSVVRMFDDGQLVAEIAPSSGYSAGTSCA